MLHILGHSGQEVLVGGLGQVGLFGTVMEVVGEAGQGVHSGQGVFIGEVVDPVESGQAVSTRDVGQGGQEGGTGQGVHSGQVVTVGQEGGAGQGVHSGQVVSTRGLGDSGQEGQVQVEGV